MTCVQLYTQVTLPIQMSARMRPIAVDMGLASISGPPATPPNSATAIVGGLETAVPSVSLHLLCQLVHWLLHVFTAVSIDLCSLLPH